MNELTGLVIDVEARITKLERGLKQANDRQRKAAGEMERRAQQSARKIEQTYAGMTNGIGSSFAKIPGLLRLGGGLLAGGIVARQVRSYTQMADAATQMQNALRVAGLEGAELSRVYEQLFTSAQKNSAPIGSLVDLYSKLALTQNELGVSSDELIRFTDGIAVALKVAGTDATSASGSLLQLSQALGGGVVRAEEFNSILEGTPTIAQAVARGLKEAGGSVAELRKLVVDGRVSSTAFFRAFEVGSAELRRQAETSQSTVGQAFTRMGNSLVTVIGEFDQTSGASANLARIVGDLADGLDSFDAAGFVSKIQSIAEGFRDAEAAASDWIRKMADAQVFADLNEAMGITEDGQFLNPDVREAERKIGALEKDVEALQAQIENNTSLGFDNTEAIARLREVRGELDALRAAAANMPRYVDGLRPDGTAVYNNVDTGSPVTAYDPPPMPASSEPVSVDDYPAGGTGKGGGKAAKGRTGGGGGGRKEKVDDYQREVEAIQRRTEALQIETAQLVLAATGERDLGEAMEFARTKADLMVAAQAQGQSVSAAQMAEIDRLADAYARAGEAAATAGDKMRDQAAKSAQAMQSGADAVGSVIDAAMNGSESLSNTLANLAKQIVRNIILQQIYNAVSKNSGGGGVFGTIISTLGAGLTAPTMPSGGYASGGFTGHGGKFEPAGVVHKGEFVFSKETVARFGAGNLERLHESAKRGYASGGLVGAAGKLTQATSAQSGGAKATPAITINSPVTVNATGGTPEQNADLARQVSAETERAMRNVVRDELVRQSRPGAMLGRR